MPEVFGWPHVTLFPFDVPKTDAPRLTGELSALLKEAWVYIEREEAEPKRENRVELLSYLHLVTETVMQAVLRIDKLDSARLWESLSIEKGEFEFWWTTFVAECEAKFDGYEKSWYEDERHSGGFWKPRDLLAQVCIPAFDVFLELNRFAIFGSSVSKDDTRTALIELAARAMKLHFDGSGFGWLTVEPK